MKNLINRNISPEHIFTAGILIIPSFIFQEDLVLKWLQVFLFVSLAFLSGKKIRIVPVLVMVSGIVSANLISPVGEVLFQLGSFPFTKGALFKGLEKSALLIGMIYISKFSVSSDLKLPGGKKNILSLVFFYFEKIMEGENSHTESGQRNNLKKMKRIINPLRTDSLIEIIDRRIIRVHNLTAGFLADKAESVSDSYHAEKAVNIFFSRIFLISAVSVNWVLFASGLL